MVDKVESAVISKGSGKSVWWICKKGHEWQGRIDMRTDSKHPTGCPFCKGRKVGSDNNFAVLFPEVAKQWHPTKNGNNSPEMYRPGSEKRAWWICDKKHEWDAIINSRARGRGCPYCAGVKKYKCI